MPPATRKPATTRRKKTAARAAITAPPEPDAPEQDDDLIVIPAGKKTAEQADAEQTELVPVFEYGGRTYGMAAEISLRMVFRTLWTMKQYDPMTGGLEAVKALLGEDALDVLLDAPEIEDEHLTAVIEKVTSHLFGLAQKQEVGKGSAAE